MKTTYGYLASSGMLLTATSLLVSSCAARLAAPAAMSELSDARAVRTATTQGAGTVAVSIPWPSFGRQGQFVYGGGSSVAAVEVFLTDSLGNYQSAVILRNPAAGGNGTFTATVPFANVPAGPVTVSVHTTYNQLLGTVITPSSAASTSFVIGANTVTPIVGDQTTQFVAFRSIDLLGVSNPNGGPYPYLTHSTVYQNSRTGTDEMTDSSSLTAGYGLGAATASVIAGQTTPVSVTVSQAPSFASNLYTTTSTFSAGTTMQLAANGVQPGDVLLATDSTFATTNDVLDLSKNLGATYPVTASASMAVFTTTVANAAKAGQAYVPLNLYLMRGTFISQIHMDSTTPPKILVEPGAISAANSSASGGATLAANGNSNLTVTLKDAFGNPIDDLSSLYLASPASTLSASVAPVGTPHGNFLLPGLTYGTVGNFATVDLVNKPGQWQATYTEGSVADSTNGATVSVNASGAGTNTTSDIASLWGLYVPYGLLNQLNPIAGNYKVTTDVTAGSGTTFNIGMFTSLPSATSSANTLLTTSISGSQNVAGLLNLGGTPQNDVLKLANPLAASDNGTLFSFNSASIGNRASGDTDSVTVQIATSSGTPSSIGSGLTYTWQ
ncbi:MAG: hypothetical protein KGR26_00725 [Cyanobacteria bacterium REEB65]|nr:hypothetical protein [Cyanobacteria bacterium REEB65]